jgi:hypothetical protein
MIHILTPCHRPDNIDIIKNSIPSGCNWIIVFDSLVENPPIVDGAVCMNSNMTGGFGSHNRNYAFDNFPFEDNDWIFWLDSDNIVHPDWYKTVKPHLNKDLAMLTWGQILKDGSVRLLPVNIPKVGEIDSASFMVKWKYVKDIRCNDGYVHDGEYAEDCSTRGRVLALNSYVSYYNYI